MAEKQLSQTASLCPVCLRRLTAAVISREDGVYLEKHCPQHGSFQCLLWQGEADYLAWVTQSASLPCGKWERPAALGCPWDCGICDQHIQDACCVLLELTQRCNQHCPYCYAAAGEGGTEYTLAQLAEMLDFLFRRSPEQPYNIQLSGGEPTLREDLPQIIALIRDKGFDYVQLNTNGKRLAADPAYGRLLKQAGLGAVFLQFDGMDDRIYQQLRGEALTAIKLRALAHCRAAALPVVLTMMVTADVNLQQIGSCFRLLLDHLPWIRGLHLQPACYSGRHPGLRQGLTLQQVLKELVAQSGGLLHQEQFSPLATGHPLCSFQGNFIRRGEQVVSVGGSSCCWGGGADIARSRRKLAQNWGERQPRQSTLPCWLDEGELQGFTVSAMAFQDGLSLDLERLRCCRVYVARPGNQLIPFCAHNISSCSGEALYPRK